MFLFVTIVWFPQLSVFGEEFWVHVQKAYSLAQVEEEVPVVTWVVGGIC
jgi:hypothetical protein